MSSGDTLPSSKANGSDAALRDLDAAEEHIIELLQIAEATTAELSKLPFCDASYLSTLAARYKELLPQVQARMQPHAGFAAPTAVGKDATGQGSSSISSSSSSSSVDYGAGLEAEMKAQMELLNKQTN